MKTGSVLVTVSLTLVAGMGLAATAAHAGGPHGGAVAGSAIVGAGPVFSGAIVPHIVPHGVVGDRIVPHGLFTLPSVPRHFGPGRPVHRRHHRRFIPIVVFGSSTIVTVLPPGLYGSPGYYDESGYYGPPGDPTAVYNRPVVYTQPLDSTVSATPSAPPPPNVVQHATGRYELRGDGVTTPYTWVWIPNPPPPPPAAPPMGPLFSGDPPSARHNQLYRWTDEQGVMHLTDRLDTVPSQYRVQAKQTPPS